MSEPRTDSGLSGFDSYFQGRKRMVDFLTHRYGPDLVGALGDEVINRCLEIINQYRKAIGLDKTNPEEEEDL